MSSILKIKDDVRGVYQTYLLMKKRKSSFSEADVQTKLIRRLFGSIGWDVSGVHDPLEVKEEVNLEGKKADSIFRYKGRAAFVVENKKLTVDIVSDKNQRKRCIEQAVEYGHSAGVSCTILTNFEYLIFLDSQKEYDSFEETVVWEIHCSELLKETGFRKLLLLTKESFSKELWEQELQQMPKRRVVRKSADEKLLKELLNWRYSLYCDIKKNYSKYSLIEIDEMIQIILNRFIFIRKCEDKGYLTCNLMGLFHEFGKKKLTHLFKKVEEEYDGKLFDKHECDKIIITSPVLKNIIIDLYFSKDKNIKYNLAAIPSDVLGEMYEQYLGHVIQEDKIVPFNGIRKKDSVYYTRKPIVDFIVQKTFEGYTKNHKDISNIKVLDPACGSGSFLIAVYDYLESYYSKKGVLTYEKKCELIKNNIFGVDRDRRAIEIARLNLHFKILEKGEKLPKEDGLKVGDSVVDDYSISKEKAFHWESKFQFLKENKFDIIIGNPPYLNSKKIPENERNYFWKKYEDVLMMDLDMYEIFTYKCLSELLKEGGWFGFITPDSYFNNQAFQKYRDYLISKTTIKNVVDFPYRFFPFKDVNTETAIIIIEKQNCKNQKIDINIVIKDLFEKLPLEKHRHKQLVLPPLKNSNKFFINMSEMGYSIINRIKKQIIFNDHFICSNPSSLDRKKRHPKTKLKQYSACVFYKKDLLQDPELRKICIPCIEGDNILRYKIHGDEKYTNISWSEKGVNKTIQNKTLLLMKQHKIVGQRITGQAKNRMVYAFDSNFYITMPSVNVITPIKSNDSESLFFLLGILNSKIYNFLYKDIFGESNTNITSDIFNDLPIPNPSNEQKKEIVELSKELTNLFPKFGTSVKTGELDKKLNYLIYKLYNLTNSEVELIEAS